MKCSASPKTPRSKIVSSASIEPNLGTHPAANDFLPPAPPTRAIALANRIQNELLSAGMPSSGLLGAEQVLCERFAVGRGTLREAIRVLEFRGIARMRRGPHGGLFVALPGETLTCQYFAGHALLNGVDGPQLLQSIHTLGRVAVELACAMPRKPRNISFAELEPLVVESKAYTLLDIAARWTGQPVLLLFSQCLAKLAQYLSAQTATTGIDRQATLRQCAENFMQALRRGDAVAAHLHFERHHQLILEQSTAQLLPPRYEDGVQQRIPAASHRAEQIARNIIGSLLRSPLPAGSRFGSEGDLCRRFDICKSVARQTARLLQDAGVLQGRRGRGRGLFIRQPAIDAPLRMICLYLRTHRVSAHDAWQVGQSLSVEAARLAAAHHERGAYQSAVSWMTRLTQPTHALERNELLALDSSLDRSAGNSLVHLMLASLKYYPTLLFERHADMLDTFIRRRGREYLQHTDAMVKAIASGQAEAAAAAQSCRNQVFIECLRTQPELGYVA